MPSIRFSKHKCMACCFSGGWLLTMLFLRSAKYCRPSSRTHTDTHTHRHNVNERIDLTRNMSAEWREENDVSNLYLFVEQDQAEQRPGHGPLVTAVLEDDDVQDRGEHLGTGGQGDRGRGRRPCVKWSSLFGSNENRLGFATYTDCQKMYKDRK